MLGSRPPLKTRIFRATLAQRSGIVCIELELSTSLRCSRPKLAPAGRCCGHETDAPAASITSWRHQRDSSGGHSPAPCGSEDAARVLAMSPPDDAADDRRPIYRVSAWRAASAPVRI